MNDVAFVDTNILVYAHDRDAGSKRDRAVRLLEELWESGNGRLSVQVLQEFYVSVTRKLATPVARSLAREVIGSYGAWVREATTPEIVLRAVEISELAQLSFWDGLVVSSAEQAGATLLYSEDFQAGRLIAGIRIVNPLVE
ncbi:MAG: PIN domain-containing protein [Acidobacteria bacterium]|nr:MAG: PIN domain-containing protein [Acidobacteriota bacterium]